MPSLDVDVSLDYEASKEKNENHDVEGGGTENENVIEIPSNNGARVEAIADHSSQIAKNEVKASDNLNAHISSIGTHLKETTIAIANDG